MKIRKKLLVGIAVCAMMFAAKAENAEEAVGEEIAEKPAVTVDIEKEKAGFTDADWDNLLNAAKLHRDLSDAKDQLEIGKRLFEDGSSKAEERHKEAVEWFQKSADQGNTAALYMLGHCYHLGRGVGHDDALAYNYWRQAADDEGNEYYSDAVYWVGKCLIDGIGVAKDEESGVEWLREAADNGLWKAQYELAFAYLTGKGLGGQNIELGLQYLEKAAEKGDGRAEWVLGALLCNKEIGHNRSAEGIKWIMKAAGNDCVEAQAFLGNAYLFGENGVDLDYELAFHWLKKAAEQGNGFSALNLGIMLLNGKGCEKNEESGFKFIKQAFDQDIEEAYGPIGRCYFHGVGVAKDRKKAMDIFAKGALDNNDAECQFLLSLCYGSRNGKNRDSDLEFFWVKCAADQGHASAINNLGDCYEKGRGVERDYAMALKYYLKAKELDAAIAWCSLGECYEKGLGVEKDGKKAIEMYEEAIRRDCSEAYMPMGRCYENGTGVEKNLEKAVEMYRKGAEEGNPDSCLELARCLEEGIGVEKNPEEAKKWREKANEW